MATALARQRKTPSGKAYKWSLGLLMVTVLGLGWKYPYLGFMVPLVMVAGLIGSFV